MDKDEMLQKLDIIHRQVKRLNNVIQNLRKQRLILCTLLFISLNFNIMYIRQAKELYKSSQEVVQAFEEYRDVVTTNFSKPEVVQAVSLKEEVIKEEEIKPVEFVVTAYCPCIKCCGKTDGITKSGVKAQANKTIAMDKSVPMGTKVKIEGFEDIEFVKEDIGGAIEGNRIDVFMNTHAEALKFGRQTLMVWIISPEVTESTQLAYQYQNNILP